MLWEKTMALPTGTSASLPLQGPQSQGHRQGGGVGKGPIGQTDKLTVAHLYPRDGRLDGPARESKTSWFLDQFVTVLADIRIKKYHHIIATIIIIIIIIINEPKVRAMSARRVHKEIRK